MLWAAAYAASDSAAFTGTVSQADLKNIYEKKTFLPSLHLANLKASDYPVPDGAAVAANAKATRSTGTSAPAAKAKKRNKKKAAKKVKAPVKPAKKRRRKRK
jgi:hypothetical protein